MECFALRKATPDDLNELIALGRKTFVETYKGMGNGSRPDVLEETFGKEIFSKQKLLPELQNSTGLQIVYVLCTFRDKPVGFMKLDETVPPNFVLQNSLHLSQIYILKEFKNLGLGKQLLKWAIIWGKDRGFANLWLGVWDMNEPAVMFYEKFGFLKIGTMPWKFQHGEINYEDTDIIMRLPL